MKKSISIFVSIVIIFGSFGAVALDSDMNELKSETIENEGNGMFDFTHTVFAEGAAKTTCPYCRYSHAALKTIYASGDYPFYYVLLVGDKNPEAYARANNYYNFYGYPTVWFDGGYKVNLGGGSGNEAQYRSSINSCGARTVEDVDVDLFVTWLGGTEMEINVSVINNEASTYGGHIYVYITEIESSMGWHDTAGYLYTFPFLDWAFNQPISISVGGSWFGSMTWDGATNGFPSVTEDNTIIIAAVFNDEWHQGYSYPPSNNPFDAYYVDETTAFRVGENRPPDTPSDPDPEDGENDVDIDADLSWTGEDPDWFDTLTYDVYFGTTSPPSYIDTIDDTDFDPGMLDYETTYYWQIVAWDNHGASSTGPIWVFTTEEEPVPDLDCDGTLSWTDVEPGSTVTGEFTVENIGVPNSELDWEITDYPDWGSWTFTPDSGENLKPEDGAVVVTVFVDAPSDPETEFFGEVRIVNSENSDDYYVIPVYLRTPVSQFSARSQTMIYNSFLRSGCWF